MLTYLKFLERTSNLFSFFPDRTKRALILIFFVSNFSKKLNNKSNLFSFEFLPIQEKSYLGKRLSLVSN